ncbi:hypothetical protein EV421DRAFT_1769035 [Armillaria borealis]|uniref:Secreted protein n=1 Tax=Armillaria borealis TaxID=47425 RepID=A0AA39K588_9AGAR|nr:hypothetical protein EV421DRAFT_1769035 [Armillaria borealis]
MGRRRSCRARNKNFLQLFIVRSCLLPHIVAKTKGRKQKCSMAAVVEVTVRQTCHATRSTTAPRVLMEMLAPEVGGVV